MKPNEDAFGREIYDLMVSKAEMQEILAGTGWAATRFIDSDSGLYIAVIEKTG